MRTVRWLASLAVPAVFYISAAYAEPLCTCDTIRGIQKDTLNTAAIARCVNELTEDMSNNKVTGEALESCRSERDTLAARTAKINDVLKSTFEPLLVDFSKYDDYFFKLTVGYEYVSVDKLFDQGFPRAGLLVYRKYSDQLHMFGNFLLTSSAEEDVGTVGEFGGVGQGVERTLDMDIQVFYAFGQGKRMRLDSGTRVLQERIGFTALLGGRRTDQSTKIDGRRYAGLRIALNPQTYADILVGKTETRESWRSELRGQMPIYNVSGGLRVYLGGIANFAIGNQRNETLDKDVVRVYVTWDMLDIASLL